MPKFVPFDQMKRELIAKGLIDESGAVTAAGHEYTRALIAHMNTTTHANAGKLRRQREQEDDLCQSPTTW